MQVRERALYVSSANAGSLRWRRTVPAVLLSCLGCLGGVCAATTVLAAEASKPAKSGADPLSLLLNGSIGLGLLVAALAALRWLGPKLYEEISRARTANRTFVAETTKSVSTLATTHYWALANCSGTLGSVLAGYLRQVEAYCFVNYDEPGTALPQRLRDLADEAADRSFASFARLVILFDRFQFRGSNTYLLPNHAAGETLRRLYNAFVVSLPDGDLARGNLLTLVRQGVEWHLAREPKPPAADPLGLYGTFLEVLPISAPSELGWAKQLWQQWLSNALPKVHEAAEALQAYSDLLSHELALLNAVFFRDKPKLPALLSAPPDGRGPGWRGVATVWSDGAWPALLTPRVLSAAARASVLPRDFAPLGGGIRPPAPDKRVSEVAGHKQDDIY